MRLMTQWTKICWDSFTIHKWLRLSQDLVMSILMFIIMIPIPRVSSECLTNLSIKTNETLSINKISYIRMEGIQTICMIAQKIKTAIGPINHLGSHQGTSILKSDNTIMGQHLQIKGIRTTPIDSLLRHIQ